MPPCHHATVFTDLSLRVCAFVLQLATVDATGALGATVPVACDRPPCAGAEAGIVRQFRDGTEASFYAYDPLRDVEAYGYYEGDALVVGAVAESGLIEVTLAPDGTLVSYIEDGDAAGVLARLVWLGYPGGG